MILYFVFPQFFYSDFSIDKMWPRTVTEIYILSDQGPDGRYASPLDVVGFLSNGGAKELSRDGSLDSVV